MEELHKKHHFGFGIFFTALVLWGIGIALIYSVTYMHASGPLAGKAWEQALWVGIGTAIMLVVLSIPPRLYYRLAYVAYAVSLIMLIYVIFTGTVTKGAGRWIALGGIRVQPSEFAKLGVLLALSRFLSNKTIGFRNIPALVISGLLIAVPAALVVQQPDLGTTLVLLTMPVALFYWCGMTFFELFLLLSPGISIVLSAIPLIISFSAGHEVGYMSSIPWGIFFLLLCVILYVSRPGRILMWVVGAANLVAAAVTTILWNEFLEGYQKERILGFVNPEKDPSGAGYQLIQSKVTAGSGHFLGKGYLHGTQTRLSFLPEQHTDFIFSALGEQFGFVGCLAVLGIFAFLIIRGLYITHLIKDRFLNCITIGAVWLLTLHIFINIGMTVGIMPVTGLPLPFLSYGGSFTVTVAILIGLILNAKVHENQLLM
jgi:rod shape determining protein RodA